MICLMSFVLLLGLVSTVQATTYYVSPSGNDNNAGTSTSTAWKTIAKVNSVTFAAGDSILFEGGQTFSGGLVFSESGTAATPIIIGSYGSGRATINSGYHEKGFNGQNAAGLDIRDLIFLGSGNDYVSTSTSTFNGIHLEATGSTKLVYIRINNVEVNGYADRGIVLWGSDTFGGFDDVRITNCVVCNIGREGINSRTGWPVSSYSHTNIYLGDCVVYNVSGIPTADTQTGSGIVLGGINGGTFEFCEAYNGGSLNAASGGGPIGIWVWESTNFVMQFNEAHHNKTMAGDGGGFDMDMGTNYTTQQYNYSHDNDGAGYLIMQSPRSSYAGNNICRFNISANDGIGHGMAALELYAGAVLANIDIYNNTFYAGPDSVLATVNAYVWHSSFSNINIRNNILIAEPDRVMFTSWADHYGINFQGNCYWAMGGPLKFVYNQVNVYTGLDWWRTQGREMLSGSPVGYEFDPKLADKSAHPVLHPRNLANLSGYKLASNSPAIDRGLNLQTLFAINPGTRDFYGVLIPQGSVYDIGANEELGGGQVAIPSDPPADTTAPTPNPMTFATAPNSTGIGSIAMVATTASDAAALVQYYFTCTGGRGHNSGWQYNTSYEDSSLGPGTTYTYTVKARDVTKNMNETAASTAKSATTNAYSGSIIFSDGFESGGFTAGGWVAESTPVGYNYVSSADAYTGTYGVHMSRHSYLAKYISTVGLTNIRIRYARNFPTNGKAGIVWWDGSQGHSIEKLDVTTTDPWTVIDVICGPEADNNPNFGFIVMVQTNHKNDFFRLDDVQIWGVGGGQPDTTPPSPNPMTWATKPYATGSTSIAMVATTATDPSGVSYFFDCTTTGGHDSAWQDSTSYTDTGLAAGTTYSYRVQARDKSANLNTTGWSTTESATTTQPDTTPPSPNPMTWATLPYATGSTSIAMVATTATDPSGVEYFFDCTTTGGHDSVWQAGTSYTDTGLSPGTMYTYRMQARDKSPNLNTTGWSTSQSATTQTGGDTTPPTPNPMTWATVPYATGSTSIAMVATTATDASGVEYYFDETSGNPGGSDSAWQDSTSYTDTGLSPSTQYTYRVQARDKSVNQNATGWSTSQSATTQSGGGPSIFFDGFESGNFTAGGWTVTGSASVTSGSAYQGTYKAFIKLVSSITTSVSTAGYTSIHLKFVARTNGFDAGEYVTAEWYDGSNWNIAAQMTSDGSYSPSDTALPSGAANNPNFKIRLSTNTSGNTEWAYLDNVEVTGQ